MSNIEELVHIEEPLLEFGFGQAMEYPKDGLMLFGPLTDSNPPFEIRVGVVGHPDGLMRYKKWVNSINAYIPAIKPEQAHHTAYPGFETIFGCKWPTEPICELPIPDIAIQGKLYLSDRHKAVYDTVSLYENEIRRYLREEDARVDVWFVVIPEEIYKLGRPKSKVPKEKRIRSDYSMDRKRARSMEYQPFLFKEDRELAQLYRYELHFHNQLKARLLDAKAVVQVVRDTSLTPEDFIGDGWSKRRVQDPSTLAWNLTTATYFKASGRPWKLADVRDGVCYVGIVFKKDATSLHEGNACCGAQMFLDSGDGLVFKGAVGPWYSDSTGEFHLPRKEASGLMRLVIEGYERMCKKYPDELFIHGRTRFNDEEWLGFQEAVPCSTSLIGIRIRDDRNFKLYTQHNDSVLRGTGYLKSYRKGFLWTRGYIPRLQTYPGREVPNPLSIEICKGEGDLKQVMLDIMGLTKVNFNACIFADGYPVTLRFADHVGEILTAAPYLDDLPPLPFKHYI